MRALRGSVAGTHGSLLGQILQPIEQIKRGARRQPVRLYLRDGFLQRRRSCGRGTAGRLGGSLEQRQLVGELDERAALLARLDHLQDILGAKDDRLRQTGEPGDMNAIASVGRARRNLIKEHDLVLPFLDPHGVWL